MKSVLDFFINIIYTDTVYIFCSLGTSSLSNRMRFEKVAPNGVSMGLLIDISRISVYFVAPNFEKSTQYFILYKFKKGMVEYHDKG